MNHTTVRIPIYAEHCVQAGQVAYGYLESIECAEDPEAVSDDIIVYEGLPETLITEARERLATRQDRRAGGAGDAYAHACARSVLEYLGASEEAEPDAGLDE